MKGDEVGYVNEKFVFFFIQIANHHCTNNSLLTFKRLENIPTIQWYLKTFKWKKSKS